VTTTCFADGVYSSCTEEICENYGTPVLKSCKTTIETNSWSGCVGARDESLHASIDNPSTPYPGIIVNCGSPIQALTDSLSTISTTITDLYASGNTHIPSGLIWGWNMLTAEAPLSEARTAAEISALNGRKVLVLMTDGINWTSPGVDGRFYEHDDSPYGDDTYANTLTSTVCENIKADGIEIYTVLFDVTDNEIETILRNCASSLDMSYVAADSDALLAAFEAIGTSLREVRLTQ
jgi:hypothetical protein